MTPDTPDTAHDAPSTRLRLRPGLCLVRRDADHLQLGIDPPHRVVLRDLPEVRRLVGDLAGGRRPGQPGLEAARALAAITAAGLLEPDDSAARRGRRRAARVAVEAADDVAAGVTALLASAGLTARSRRGRPDAVLLVTRGEPARERLDGWVREGVPHLLVRDHGPRLEVGPFVVPGVTACLRCADCHLGEHDPRRGLVVEQAAARDPLVPVEPDPALRAVALSLAVCDLVGFAEGARPASWSASITVTRELDLAARPWLRHPACGCAWADLAQSVG